MCCQLVNRYLFFFFTRVSNLSVHLLLHICYYQNLVHEKIYPQVYIKKISDVFIFVKLTENPPYELKSDFLELNLDLLSIQHLNFKT